MSCNLYQRDEATNLMVCKLTGEDCLFGADQKSCPEYQWEILHQRTPETQQYLLDRQFRNEYKNPRAPVAEVCWEGDEI